MQLIERLRCGERAAFDEVYATHRTRLYAFLLRLCGRRDVADDLFQETWTKFAQHAPSLRDDSDLAAWLFTVARNAYRSHRRWALLDLSRMFRGDDPYATAPSNARGPDAEVEGREQRARLERALASLPEKSREALLLVAVEAFEQEQAAAIVGISYAAFRQRLTRARAELALALQKAERHE